MDGKLVKTLYGDKGIYEIRVVDVGMITRQDKYKIYKDGEEWKEAWSAKDAIKKIENYDSSAK